MRRIHPPRRLDSLPLSSKLRLASDIVVTYVWVRWQLRRREDFNGAVAAIRAQSSARAPHERDDIDGATLEHLRSGMVRTLTKLPADSRCLMRSLVLLSLLARRGVDTTLVIGVRSQPKFDAHAWIEERGIPLLPTGRAEYMRLVEL